jgi:hypothetical protein
LGLTSHVQSDKLIHIRTTLTDVQRSFRRTREAADRGDSVIVVGENGDAVFERRNDFPSALCLPEGAFYM